jgi:hypothetical protein
VRRWIVRPPADASLAELVLAGVDRITILTSADEAARVTAYRLVKDLHLAAARVGTAAPPLGVALLGCDPESGRRVFERLQQTARTHLDVDVTLDMCLPRMDASIVSSGWRRGVAGEPPVTLERVIAWTQEASPPAPGPQAPGPAAAKVTPPVPAPAPPAPRTEAAPPAPRVEAGTSAEPWIGRRTVKLRPRPDLDIEPKAPCLPREPDIDGKPRSLASYVGGLLALPVRCPHHESVELAVDERGRLHLLGEPQSLRDMAVVRQWALDHRELLALACPEHIIDASRPVRLHVFAATPLDVADLHGSDVQLHVLAPVDVEGRRGWYAAPLNAVKQG